MTEQALLVSTDDSDHHRGMEQLRAALSSGWKVKFAVPMSGADRTGNFALVIIEEGKGAASTATSESHTAQKTQN